MGGSLLRTRVLSQLLTSSGQVLLVCGVICHRRDQSAHKPLLLETRTGMTAPDELLCSWVWRSQGDRGKPSPNSMENLLFSSKPLYTLKLEGYGTVAIDLNP